MNESEEYQAFCRGIEKFCSENGTPEFSTPIQKFASFSDSFSLNPEAFVSGFNSFVKRAMDEDTVDNLKYRIRKILPWIMVPAGIYGAAKFGDIWGRHAYANDDNRGPVAGPIMSLMESLSGTKLQRVGRRNAMAMRSDWKSKPLTADQLDWYQRTGSTVNPEVFG